MAFRLLSAGAKNTAISHLSFTSLEQFYLWAESNRETAGLFLVDYEFLAQDGNGLDAIERAKISDRAILVTSRFEEQQVRSRADSLGIKILPKGLAPFVPVSIDSGAEKYDAILIDNDPLQHLSWQVAAKDAGRKMIAFATSEDFFRESCKIDPKSPLFIDVSLDNGVRGEAVAAQASSHGFKEIYLATGYDKETITAPSCVRGIVGKDPLFF